MLTHSQIWSPLVASLLIGVLAVLGGVGLVSAVTGAAILGACGLVIPSAGIASPAIALTEGVLRTSFGVTILIYASYLSRLGDIALSTALIVVLGIFSLLHVVGLRWAGKESKICTSDPGSARIGAGAAFVALVYCLPLLYADFRMGAGLAPSAFYSPDAAYYLIHVHEFLQGSGLPPPSISVAGIHVNYHYGIQSAAAAFAELTGAKAHQALFLTIAPVVQSGFVAAAIIFKVRFAPKLPSGIAVAVLLFGMPHLELVLSAVRVIVETMRHPTAGVQYYHQYFGYEMLNTSYSQFATLLLIPLFLERNNRQVWAGAALLGAFVVIKPQAFLLLGLLAGFAALIQAVGERSATPIMPAALALGLAIILMHESKVDSAVTLAFEPRYFFSSFSTFLEERGFSLLNVVKLAYQIFYVALPYALAVVALVLPLLLNSKEMRWITLRRALPLLAAIFFAQIFVILVRLYPVNSDRLQILTYMFLLGGAVIVMTSNSLMHRGAGWRRVVIVIILTLAAVAPVLTRTTLTALWFGRPEASRDNDYVDNLALNEALSVVPVQGSLIVVNDIRYPSYNFARLRLQTQYAAVYGHTFYLTVAQSAEIHGFGNEVALREAVQQHFSEPVWTAAHDRLVAEHPEWTHFLVHRHWGYPKPVPFRRIFENDTYIVYHLRPSVRSP